MRARLRPAHAAIAAAIVGLAVFGCQAIVSGDAPTFACASTDPSACPAGKTCDVASGRCVDQADDGGDLDGGDDALAPPVDGGADQDAGPAPLGTPCRVDSECGSGLCGTNAMLTPAITAGTGPVCTASCCTSSECPASFVCFSPGTGGSYCVAAAKLSRTPKTNGAGPGASCTRDADCRSGNCAANRCLDTCCSNQNCVAGSTCRIVTVDLTTPTHDVWACAPATGPKDAGAACVDNTECKSNACVSTGNGNCRAACCGSATCGAAGFPGSRCVYGPTGSDVFKLCTTSPGGTLALGAPCQTPEQCKTGYCDAEFNVCAETCCVDSDCPPKQVCRPAAVQTPYLRCVPK